MTEEQEAANTALLLDENIEKRIHIAVGRLFGFDVVKNYWMPPPEQHTAAYEVRKYVTTELVREMSRMLLNDHEVIRGLYERLAYVQRDRRQQFNTTTTNSSQIFF